MPIVTLNDCFLLLEFLKHYVFILWSKDNLHVLILIFNYTVIEFFFVFTHRYGEVGVGSMEAIKSAHFHSWTHWWLTFSKAICTFPYIQFDNPPLKSWMKVRGPGCNFLFPQRRFIEFYILEKLSPTITNCTKCSLVANERKKFTPMTGWLINISH